MEILEQFALKILDIEKFFGMFSDNPIHNSSLVDIFDILIIFKNKFSEGCYRKVLHKGSRKREDISLIRMKVRGFEESFRVPMSDSDKDVRLKHLCLFSCITKKFGIRKGTSHSYSFTLQDTQRQSNKSHSLDFPSMK